MPTETPEFVDPSQLIKDGLGIDHSTPKWPVPELKITRTDLPLWVAQNHSPENLQSWKKRWNGQYLASVSCHDGNCVYVEDLRRGTDVVTHEYYFGYNPLNGVSVRSIPEGKCYFHVGPDSSLGDSSKTIDVTPELLARIEAIFSSPESRYFDGKTMKNLPVNKRVAELIKVA